MPIVDAFCGTYVGGVGSEFYNEYSQLVVVRDNNSTTLTIVNDVQGNFDSFALVIPVPEVIPEDKSLSYLIDWMPILSLVWFLMFVRIL